METDSGVATEMKRPLGDENEGVVEVKKTKLSEEAENDVKETPHDGQDSVNGTGNGAHGADAEGFGGVAEIPTEVVSVAKNIPASGPRISGRDGNYTSEIFKIEINGLPRHVGYGQLKKFLSKLGLEPKKVRYRRYNQVMPSGTGTGLREQKSWKPATWSGQKTARYMGKNS